MSSKGTILIILALLLTRFIWAAVFNSFESNGLVILSIALFYIINSIYIDYIFCKYKHSGKYQYIDEQAREGDWFSCFYIADSVLALGGGVLAIFALAIYWHYLFVKICLLAVLCCTILFLIPVFRTARGTAALLRHIFRLVVYGTVQRTGYLVLFITGVKYFMESAIS